jgi:hypothetical protein
VSQPTHGKPKPTDPQLGSGEASREPEAGAAPAVRDTVLIHGVSEDGASFAVLRAREDRLEAGIVRKVRDGEPLHGELLRLTPRPESPLLCDVEVQYAPPSARAAGASEDAAAAASRAPKLMHGGPAQVATPDYRTNWDAIWSRPHKSSAPN